VTVETRNQNSRIWHHRCWLRLYGQNCVC